MSSDTRAERSKAFSWALSARAMHDAGTSPEGTPRAYRSENAAFPGAGSADDASRDLAHAPSSRRRLIVGQAYHQGNCGTTPTRVESFLDGPSLRHAVHMRVLWLAAALLGICACALMRGPSPSERCLDLGVHCYASHDCCSAFCANGDCVENPYAGSSTLLPRDNEPARHAE